VFCVAAAQNEARVTLAVLKLAGWT